MGNSGGGRGQTAKGWGLGNLLREALAAPNLFLLGREGVFWNMPSEKSCQLQASKTDACTPQNRPVYSTEGFSQTHPLHDPNSGLELASQECLGLENPLGGTDQLGRAGPALGWVIMGGGAGLTLTWHNHGQLHPPISQPW